MKDFINYITAITKDPYLPKKAKQTTTILMPELDTTEGIYRSLLPSYIINGSKNDFRMLVVGITTKTGLSHNAKDFDISPRLIAETDHFVFPFVNQPLREVVKEIREIKPGVKFSLYIDFNYYAVPDSYPFAKEYKLKRYTDVIEDNIRVVDQVICTNDSLIDFILAKIKETYPGEKFGTDFLLQRLCILPNIMSLIDHSKEPVRGSIKALIIGDEYQFSDINYIIGTLKSFKEKYKEAFDLNIIGWDGIRGDKNYLKGMIFNHYARVPFSHYFELIRHIAPTVLIIPGSQSKFNDTSKNYIKYLEFAHMNIPVIAPNIAPYRDIIKTNENGFLCDEKEAYLMQLETILPEPVKFENVLGLAYATASDYKISNEQNIQSLINIYFPDHAK